MQQVRYGDGLHEDETVPSLINIHRTGTVTRFYKIGRSVSVRFCRFLICVNRRRFPMKIMVIYINIFNNDHILYTIIIIL